MSAYKYKTVIFDMDGTVLNTVTDLMIALNHALTLNGMPTRTEAEVKSFLGNGMKYYMERAVAPGSTEAEIEAVTRAFGEYYMAHCNDNTRPFDGIPELMTRLHNDGLRLAIVSNKPDKAAVALNELFFKDFTDLTMGEREGLKRKPAPDMVWEALRILDSKKEEAVYIGDSEVDYETAKNAGLPCILVRWGFRTPETLKALGATMIAESPEDILKFLK